MVAGIYFITNLKTSKFYIGSSSDIHKRWKQHKRLLVRNKHKNFHLQKSWNKYGANNFEFSIDNESSKKDLFVKEQSMLDQYFNSGMLYNVSPFASGGDIINNHPDKHKIINKIITKTKKWMSRLSSRERKDRWSLPGNKNPNFGKRWNSEQREKASSVLKKKFESKKEREKISKRFREYYSHKKNRKRLSDFAKTRIGAKNPFYGKKHSNKTKLMLRMAHLGKFNNAVQSTPVCINGVIYKSLGDASRKLDIPVPTILWRVKSKNARFTNYTYPNRRK